MRGERAARPRDRPRSAAPCAPCPGAACAPGTGAIRRRARTRSASTRPPRTTAPGSRATPELRADGWAASRSPRRAVRAPPAGRPARRGRSCPRAPARARRRAPAAPSRAGAVARGTRCARWRRARVPARAARCLAAGCDTPRRTSAERRPRPRGDRGAGAGTARAPCPRTRRRRQRPGSRRPGGKLGLAQRVLESALGSRGAHGSMVVTGESSGLETNSGSQAFILPDDGIGRAGWSHSSERAGTRPETCVCVRRENMRKDRQFQFPYLSPPLSNLCTMPRILSRGQDDLVGSFVRSNCLLLRR